MKLISLFTAASLAVGVLCNSLDPPNFTRIFEGYLTVDLTRGLIPGHQGKRYLVQVISGNVTDTQTGELTATWEPIGGQHGALFNNNFIFSDVDFVLKWADDNTYAYWKLIGCGTIADGLYTYARLETSSPSRQDWQDNFFMFYMNTAGNATAKPVAFYKMDIEWAGKIEVNNTFST